MDTYQNQLRALTTMIDRLLPIETQLEQKLTACEYHNNYQVINYLHASRLCLLFFIA